MSIRPAERDDGRDVVSDVLGAVRLGAEVFGRVELGAPWAVRVPAGDARMSPQLAAAALRLIHARPAEAWTVERLAREVALSRSAFAARFTELVGLPPLQYLTQWRMTEAAQRLCEGNDSVACIAERVGYRNPAAFMKAFARVHGVGPGTYRRAARRAASRGARSRPSNS